MAIRTRKILTSRAALRLDIKRLVSEAQAMQGHAHPGECDVSRDELAVAGAILRKVVDNYFDYARTAERRVFTVRFDQISQCIDEKCNGQIVLTGVTQDGSSQIELEQECKSCGRSWWV